MKLFKPMTLEEAKRLYEALKEENNSSIVRIALNDIWFFTDGLTKNY